MATILTPLFSHHYTRVHEPLLQDCYIKEPGLIHYGNTNASNDVASLLLDEAAVCEVLKTNSHPNIAQYLGCRVEDSRITGLCFVQYGENLLGWVKKGYALDINSCLKDIKDGIRHLHDLGFVHCDVNPANMLWMETTLSL